MNGLKSIAINLAGIKSSADDGSLSLNKTALTLKTVAGIDVYSDKKKGQLKSMTQILDEVKEKWASLDDDERKGLSEAIAGKQQSAVFNAVMKNYETYRNMQKELSAGDHFGSMEAENSQYIDSIAGKLNHLKEVWISIGTTMVKSEFTKGLLDGAIAISEAIDKIVQSLDKVNMLTPVIAGFGVSFTKMMRAMMTNRGASSGGIGFFSTLKNDITQSGTVMQRFGRVTDTVRTSMGLVGTTAKSALKFVGGFALQGLGITALTIGVQKLAKGWDYLTNNLKNSQKQIQENMETLKSDISSSNDKLNMLKENRDRYDELIQKQKEYNKSGKELTADQKSEMQELLDMQKELAETFPELVIGNKADGSPILSMSTDVDGLIKKLEMAVEQKNRLLDKEENDDAKIARKQMQEGEKIGDGGGTLRRKAEEERKYADDIKKVNDDLATALEKSQGFMRNSGSRESFLRDVKKAYDKEKEISQKHYESQIEMYQESIDIEARIQKGALNKIETQAQHYRKLEGENKSFMEQFSAQINWGEFDEKGETAMVRFVDNISKELDKGNPKVKEWTDAWNKANEEFSVTGDNEKYAKSLSGIAKGLSEMTNTDYDTVMKGLSQIFMPLDRAQQKLQDFLKTYNKSVLDLQNGDSIATGLADQFRAVNNAIETAIDEANQIDGNISPKILLDMSKNGDLPQEINDFINGVLKDDKVDNFEHETFVNMNFLFEQGKLDGFDKEYAQLQKVLDGKASDKELQLPIKIGDVEFDKFTLQKLNGWNELNKDNQINIDALFNVEGLDQLDKLEQGLNKARDSEGTELDLLVKVVGQEKADLYYDIIQKISAKPEMTNKFILENQDALSEMKDIEEVKAWLQNNPDIINTYQIKNVKALDDAKNKKEDLEKDGTANTDVNVKENGVDETKDKVEELNETVTSTDGKEVNIKANEENIVDSIKDVETLINLSAKIEDGKYKIDIDANTQGAIDNINNLKDAVNELSNQFRNSPITTIKFNVETAQGAKNITGLKARVDEYKSLSSSVPTTKFKTDTATASKNVTGLKNNVSSYVKSYGGKTISTRFNCITALASQNVTGLKRNVASYVSSYGNKTFTTTFKVVTNKITNSVQTGGGDKGEPLSLARNVSAPTTNTVNTAPSRVRRSISEPVFMATPSPTMYTPSPMLMSMATASMSSIPMSASSISSPMVASRSLSTYSSPMAIAPNSFSFATSRAMPRRTQSTPIAIAGKDIQDALKYDVELLKELENRINKVNNQLSLLDTKMENAVGTEKIGYLQQQNALYQEQLDLQKELQDKLQRQKNNYESYLKGKGFQFNSEGNLRNYEEKLIAMEKEAERLQNIANKDKSTDGQKKASENYNKSLSETKKFLEAYIQVATTDLLKVEEEFEKIKNSIEDNNQAIKDFKNEIRDLKVDAMFVSMNKQVKQYGNELSKLDALMENAFGDSDRLDLMSKKMEIMKKQIQQYQKMLNYSQNEMNNVKKELEGFGFTFRANGDIINYTSLIVQLKESNKEFERAEELVSKYLDLLTEKIPGFENDIIDVNNAIFEMQWAMDEVVRKQKMFADTAKLKELGMEYDKLSDKLSLIDEKMKYAYGKDKIALIELQIETLKKQTIAQQDYITSYKNMMGAYQSDLGKFGIQFDKDGGITNLQTVMNDMKDSQSLDKLLELVDEYLDIQRDKLPDAVKEWESLNNAIKDSYKEQLEITKNIQDKITQVYKKQVEERKKLIDDELKHRLDSLNKEKKAYNDSRKEADYQRDLQDQKDVISDLQKKIDIAKKDSSEGGKKKLQELLKQMKEEQRKLQDMVQDKIDQDVNDMFDQESDRLEEEADKAKEELDEKYSDEKLKDIVKQALTEGVFVDIDGNIRDLEETLLEFEDKFGDGMTAVGSIIKSELIANLEVAKESFKDLDKILDGLDLSDFNTGRSIMPNAYTQRSYEPNSNRIEFNAPLLVVEGDVTEGMMPQLRGMMDKIKDEVTEEIVREIR